MPGTERPKPRERSSGRRDVLIVALVVAVLFGLGVVLGIFDRFEHQVAALHHLDEVLGLAVLSLCGVAVIAARRSSQAERKQRMWEETDARLRALIEESPAVSYSWDPSERRNLYVSPQVDRIFGVSPERYADDWIDMIHPDDRERVVEISEASDETGRTMVVEYRVVRPDGRVVWIHDEANYGGFDADGKPHLAHGVMYDITAQREADERAAEAEERLREAEERWRTLLEHLPVVAYMIDSTPDRAVGDRWVAPGIATLTGYSPEEWLRDITIWEQILHPEDRAAVIATWEDTAERGRPFDMEYRMIHRDGHVVWVHDQAASVMRGDRFYAEGVFLDVTERRLAELALGQAEDRYRTLVEQLPAITYIEEPGTGRYVYISPQVEQVYGYAVAEWMDDPQMWEERIHPDDRARVLDLSDTGGDAWSVDYRSITRDGREIWVHNEAVLLRDENGEPLHWQGVVYDITERKLAEERLREAEERYRLLVEQLPIAVYSDAVDELSTALYVSPQYEQLTGYSPEERLRDPDLWVRMLHPEDRGRVLEESARTNDTGDPFDVEYRIVTADGNVAWLHDHAMLVAGPGGTPIWQGVLQDVTERRVAEDALARRDAILQATGFAAERFLRSPAWADALGDVLGRLGASARASRCHVYVNEEGEDGELLVSLVHAWSAGGVGSVDDPVTRHFPWVRGGFERWTQLLSAHRVVHGLVRDFPEQERLVLERDAASIRSLIAVPVFANDAWWGYIGFDHREEDRIWHDAEIEALTVTANTLGAAIERERSARRLAEAQARHRSLIETIPAVTYIDEIDEPWTTNYVSPQVEAIFGYTPEEWCGTTNLWRSRLHPEDREQMVDAVVRHNTTSEPFDMEYRFLQRDGRWMWVRDQAFIVRDDDGNALYSQGVMYDITEMKAAESRLREAEERYRGIVEHVPAAIYLDRADPVMASVYISPQITAIAGVSPEAWLEDPELWLKLMDPADREEVQRTYLHAARSGIPWSAEYRMHTPDGRTIWVHDETTFLHDEDGTPSYLQGVIFDITERKLAEQALRESEQRERDAAERLRALDEMKNTFLAAVSHELRSPLTSILGLSLTLERGPSMAEADRSDLLRRLATNAKKLDRLLRDLLDIDRLNRGIVEPQYRVTDVGALARRTVESLDMLAGRDVVAEAEPVVIAIDPAKVERIIENLLMNAARHTAADRRIWLKVAPRDGGVLVSVEDDGPGVPVEIREAIFEPFRQGPTASPHSPGTGIGLSLVARFAQLHGGRAWADDRDGGGAAFHVFLPGRPGPTPSLGAREGASPLGDGDQAYERADVG